MLKLALPNGRQSRELEMILVNRREMIRKARHVSTTRSFLLFSFFYPMNKNKVDKQKEEGKKKANREELF